MIANFYHYYKLLTWKNLEIIPRIGEKITYSNQVFTVKNIILDIDKCEYNIHIARI